TPATIYLYRDDKLIGQVQKDLSAGKNLLQFTENLPDAGFYKYDVRVEAPGDMIPQNNKASTFVTVKGEPEILVISADVNADGSLVAALQSAHITVKHVGVAAFPSSLAEMDNYDAIFISNISAGDMGRDNELLLESAVRDFGVGLVCVGGEDTYAA